MTGWQRFRQARILVAGTTIALLAAVWSALTLHDLRPEQTVGAADAAPAAVTTSQQQAATAGTTSAGRSQAPTQKTTTTHTRTRAS
jgi:hypothetical protein